MKRCSTCSEEKSLTAFYKDRRKPSGLTSQCKLCQYQSVRKWRSGSENFRRRSNLKTKYGMSPADYDKLVAAQDNRCAICLEAPKANMNLCIDHDHASGLIRGLLCHGCNRGIGLLKDSATNLNRAASYVARRLVA